MKYYITHSPWPSVLPNGTQIVKATPPAGEEGNWFQPADGANHFPGDPNGGKFKLWSNEYETK